MINFAHGDVFMVGAFTALIVFHSHRGRCSALPVVVKALLIMMIVAMLLTSLYNWTIEGGHHRPLRGFQHRLAR